MANVSIPRYNWLNEGIHGVCAPKVKTVRERMDNRAKLIEEERRRVGNLGFRDVGAATSFPVSIRDQIYYI